MTGSAIPAAPTVGLGGHPITGRATAAVIIAQLLVRTGSAAVVFVVGSYVVSLAHHGVPIGSLVLGVLAALSSLAELVVAPAAGAASDRHGRRVFLLAAPLLAAMGVLLTPGASVVSTAPSLVLIVAVIATARLIDGAGVAVSVPATLSIIADATDGDRLRRGRLAALYELSSTGGITLGAVIGPLLYALAGLWSFALLAVLYVAAAGALALFVRRDTDPTAASGRVRSRVHLRALTAPRVLAFLPAWIAVNAVLGVWITAQITFVLAGPRHMAGQRFPGALAGHETWLSAILGGYVLVFALCTVAWAFLAGRLRTVPAMAVTVSGSIVASAGLMLANHGLAVVAAAPIVIVGVFLESGFTPAALTHLADVSADAIGDRGLVMGVYSVVLSAGTLLGTLLGGVFAAWLSFDGLAWITVILAILALASLPIVAAVEHRMPRSPRS